jgi:hypothetical protein
MASHTKIRKFTKTQYNYLASALKDSEPNMAWLNKHNQWRKDANTLAEAFEQLDGNFDKQRFLTQCGIKE